MSNSLFQANGLGDAKRLPEGPADLGKGVGAAPQLAFLDSLQPVLTPQLRALLYSIALLAARQAESQGIQIQKAEVSRVLSADHGVDQIIFRQFVDGSPADVQDFWDALSDAVEAWAASLQPEQRDTIINDIAIDVHG